MEMVPRTFVVARDPAAGGFVVRVPVDGHDAPLWFAVDVAWPSDARVRCRPCPEPDAVEALDVVDQAVVASSVRRGPNLDVVLGRATANRVQFALSPAEVDARGSAADGAGDVVFWQTAATVASAAPRQRIPTARERGVTRLDVVVDTREQSPWGFDGHDVAVTRRKLDAGDYAVERDGRVVAAVERKKASDLRSGLTRGRLPSQLAALAALPRAAVVVEASYARALTSKRVAKGRMADMVASVQAAYPNVPVVFAGSRESAEEWAYRWLAASLSHHDDETAASALSPSA